MSTGHSGGKNLGRIVIATTNKAVQITTVATRCKRVKQQDVSRAAKLVCVDVTPSSQTKAPIEIVLDQPLRIAVTSGFDAELLCQVVRVLENHRCSELVNQ